MANQASKLNRVHFGFVRAGSPVLKHCQLPPCRWTFPTAPMQMEGTYTGTSPSCHHADGCTAALTQADEYIIYLLHSIPSHMCMFNSLCQLFPGWCYSTICTHFFVCVIELGPYAADYSSVVRGTSKIPLVQFGAPGCFRRI